MKVRYVGLPVHNDSIAITVADWRASRPEGRFPRGPVVVRAEFESPGWVPLAGAELAASIDGRHRDILVNNTGIARFARFAYVSTDELQDRLSLNLLSPYLLTQSLLPSLLKSKGSVINISCTSANRLIPGRPASVYAMTYGGPNSLTKALALEVGPQRVRVNTIAPGTINTR